MDCIETLTDNTIYITNSSRYCTVQLSCKSSLRLRSSSSIGSCCCSQTAATHAAVVAAWVTAGNIGQQTITATAAAAVGVVAQWDVFGNSQRMKISRFLGILVDNHHHIHRLPKPHYGVRYLLSVLITGVGEVEVSSGESYARKNTLPCQRSVVVTATCCVFNMQVTFTIGQL